MRDTGITTGCGNGRYCGSESVNRGQMSVFLLRAVEYPNRSFSPPTGVPKVCFSFHMSRYPF